MKKIIIILSILLLSMALLSANGDHQSEIEEGRQLVESGVDCDKLTNEQLETIGEYLMEQMHPGEAHEAMHEMMGMEEGTEYHEQVHVNMAKMMYCGERGAMSSGMMDMMMGRTGMMGSSGNMMTGYANYGYFGGMGIFGWLFMILVIVALVLLIMWLIKEIQKPGRRR
jgi:hypothetical protein